MQVSAPQAASVVELTLEPGDELVQSLKKVLSDLESDAFVVGAGEVEDVELLTLAASGGARSHRKLVGSSDLVALSGAWSRGELELRASCSRDSELGAVTAGGLLVRAVVVSAQIRIVFGGGVTSGVAIPAPTESQVTSTAARAPQASAAPSPAALPLPPPRDSSPSTRDERPSSPGATAGAPAMSPPLPPKPRRNDAVEAYPEENDVVTHFAFGRCVVIFSDGERIRFQQERDGRVREVALSMLRIGEPTVLEDGRRHWELNRKN